MKVITISGKAEAGKDSTAKMLKNIYEKQYGRKVLIVHYADYLKYICTQYFGWDGKKNLKGRALLQYVGTDLIRKKNPDFWATTVANLLDVVGSQYDYILIPDTRFPNEVELMKNKFNTLSINIVRLDFENSLTPEQRLHPSETALDGYRFDYVVRSESGLDNLEREISGLAILLS